jgi:hypothetical protein
VSWYLAPSLVRLRNEVNARWPDRDTASDGAIGDAAHAARPSEHNPDDKGCVHAIDIDTDGVDPALILARCIAHPAAWYVIWNRHIYRRKTAFKAEAYTGADPHTGHLHISITLSAAAENSTAPWGIKEDDMPLTDDDLDKIRAVVDAGVKNYWEKGPVRQLGDGSDSVPLRMLNIAGRDAYWARSVGIPAILTALGKTGDVDETALAGALAPLLQRDDIDEQKLAETIVSALPDTLARQVLDGLGQRLTTT